MALLGAVSAAMPARASAIQTTPSVPSKIDGAFLITGYAFQGNNLLYVQVENTSRQVASIDGWRLETVWTGGGRLYDEVTPRGLVAPGAKVIIADHTVVPSASVLFSNSANVSPIRLTGIRLLAPSGSSLNDSAVTVATTDTGSNPTPRVAASPPIFYFSRNTSSATGSYLTTFAAFTPNQYTQEEGDSFTLQSDGFYEAPSDTGLRIVEIYAKPMECSPLSLNELCREYVKIFNPTDEPLLLGPYRLRSGSSGQSSTSSNTYALPNLLLPAKTYITYPLGLVDSGAWVWLEDAYGVRMYETTMVQYPSFSSKTGMSWALHRGKRSLAMVSVSIPIQYR